MKTTQIMSRPFMGLTVQQIHNSKYFNLTDLAKIAEAKGGVVARVELDNWSDSVKTREFMVEICRQEGLAIEDLLIRKRGKFGGTWAHPLLMVDFAMWLSPEFKYHAVKWAHDNLCTFRDESGDSANEMTAACKDHLEYYKPWQYARENEMVNRIASVPSGARNELTEKQLARLLKIQRANTRLIESGVRDINTRERKIREAIEMAKLFA